MELLRRHSALPVIFLTSKDDEQDEEAGFAMGADDYISKPFSLRLLLARVRAILRRSDIDLPDEPGSPSEAPRPSEVLERGRLVMAPARHKVTWDGRAVSLTVTEFLLLEALAVRPGVIKSRNQLMDAAYPDDVFVDDRTVDSHIKRMRRKFRSVDPQFSAIDTLYGAGYSFAESCPIHGRSGAQQCPEGRAGPQSGGGKTALVAAPLAYQPHPVRERVAAGAAGRRGHLSRLLSQAIA